MKKKRFYAVTLIVLLVLCFAGCTVDHPQSDKVDVELPATTSPEADVYAHGNQLFSRAGTVIANYTVDESGNVVDADGVIVIAADNVEQFTCTERMEIVGETSFAIKAERMDDDMLATMPVKVALELDFEPKDAVNKIITLESRDPGALYFSYDANEGIIADGIEKPEDDAMPSITIDLKKIADHGITIIGTFEGEYTVTARNCFGEQIAELKVTFVPEYVDDINAGEGDDIQEHEHEFKDTVVEPTQKAQGYTLHVCEICGYAFRDSYVDQLPCQHDYKETVVPATYTAGGYTLHVCQICGNSYKDQETPVLICKHESTKDTVVAPGCEAQGYTLHECTVCKNYSFKDSYTNPTGHDWDSGRTTKTQTCGAAGERTYTCKTCDETKTEAIPATGNHSYTETVVPPVCDEGGYTVHTCSVCGDSYRDSHTPALGHTDPQWGVVKEATCGESGVREGICIRCGKVIKTETIPATGNHSYTASVIPPTCESGGHTVHTCSVCGHSYTDSPVAALGHAWESHTEHILVGQESHNICKGCGQDFHGWSQSAVSDHQKVHLLSGVQSGYYSKMVDIYEDVTVQVCARCGKTQ